MRIIPYKGRGKICGRFESVLSWVTVAAHRSDDSHRPTTLTLPTGDAESLLRFHANITTDVTLEQVVRFLVMCSPATEGLDDHSMPDISGV